MARWADRRLLGLLRQSAGCQEGLLSRHLTPEKSETSVLFHPDLPRLLTWQQQKEQEHTLREHIAAVE